MQNRFIARSLLVLCLSLFSFFLNAQTVYTDYWDGSIYLKIHEKSGVHLPDFDAKIHQSAQYPFLNAFIENFGIQKIEIAFKRLKTPIFENTYRISFQNTLEVEKLTHQLETLGYVEYAEKVPLETVDLIPNDPNANASIQYTLNTVQAYDAWDLSTGSSSVVVAVVDDAVRIDHEDLAANIWTNTDEIPNNGVDDDGNGYIDDINGWDGAMNDNNPNPPSNAGNFYFSHGTHCAGIAGAVTNNGRGIAAISYNVQIMACKGARDSDAALTGIWNAFEYAMENYPEVISCSWGGGGFSNTAQNLVNEARNRGIVVVAAAGNDNVSSVFYPAGYNNVISVASTANGDGKSSFSNYGSWIDIAAPGSSIASTVATTTTSYEFYSGTSMACPNVASLIGLMLSYNPTLTPPDVEACLYAGADNIDAQNPSFVGLLGAGRINALNTLICVNPTGCLTPNGLIATSVTGSSATLNWNNAPNSINYAAQYRLSGTSTWTTTTTTNNSWSISGLSSCSTYEFQVQSACDAETSNFSTISTFTTPQTGLQNYCAASGDNSSFEWIQSVEFATLNNSTGNNGGYENFSCTTVTLTQGDTYAITLTPGFPGQTYTEYFKAWIDYNQDGTFDDATELVYDQGTASINAATGNVLVSATSLTGLTTMRVVMKWVDSSDPDIPTACGNFEYGEVEDYAVNIIDGIAPPVCATPTGLNATNIQNNAALLTWAATSGATAHNLRAREVGTTTWTTAVITDLDANYTGLNPCSDYEFEIQAFCGTGILGDWSGVFTFTTTGCAAPCVVPSGLAASNIVIDAADLGWTAVAGAINYNVRYKPTSTATWVMVNTTNTTTMASALTECIEYEFQVQTVCANATSDFSASTLFTTECAPCDVPLVIGATVITPTSAKIEWQSVPAALSYDVRVRIVGNANWITANILDLDADLTNAASCTDWEFQIRSVCNSGTSDWSTPILNFSTAGCVPTFCTSQGENSTEEWIGNVTIGTIDNATGDDGGYADYTNLSTDLEQGSSNAITLTPEYANTLYEEYWRVWIDFNQDFDFDDPGELAYDAGAVNIGAVNGIVTVPADALLGATTMRVAMKWTNATQDPDAPEPCMIFAYGEVEDYSVNIIEPTPPPVPDLIVQIRVLLEGTYDMFTNEMTTILNDDDLLPLEQPFSRPPWLYQGPENMATQADFPDEVVDWVLIELRDPADENVILQQEAALLLKDGTVIDHELGINGVLFDNSPVNQEYYVTVRARSHVDVLSAVPILLPNAIPYDFTIASSQAFGNNQMKEVDTDVFALVAGDFDHNGLLTVTDFNVYSLQASSINDYFDADVNMDKAVSVADFNYYQPNASAIGAQPIRY